MLISAINLLSEEVRRAAYAGQFHVFPHISANRYSPCSAVRYLYCGYAPQDRSDVAIHLISMYSNWNRYPWLDLEYCSCALLWPNVSQALLHCPTLLRCAQREPAWRIWIVIFTGVHLWDVWYQN